MKYRGIYEKPSWHKPAKIKTMGKVKHYNHDLIERQSRMYNILELQKMNQVQLLEIASAMNITVGEAAGKQTLVYAILEQQAL